MCWDPRFRFKRKYTLLSLFWQVGGDTSYHPLAVIWFGAWIPLEKNHLILYFVVGFDFHRRGMNCSYLFILNMWLCKICCHSYVYCSCKIFNIPLRTWILWHTFPFSGIRAYLHTIFGFLWFTALISLLIWLTDCIYLRIGSCIKIKINFKIVLKDFIFKISFENNFLF